MVLTNFEKALIQIKSNKDFVERLVGKVAKRKGSEITLVKVVGFLKEVDKLETQVKEGYHELAISAPHGTDMEAYNKELHETMDILDEVRDGLEETQESFNPLQVPQSVSAPPAPRDPTTQPSADLKLPKLELPSFSGDISDWLHFRDLFLAAVHDNPKLSDAQKLTYLRSSLTADASKVIKSISSTNENYSIAWNLLVDRFHNERELFFAVLQRLFSQPNLTSESATGLRSLVDTSKECVRSLEILKAPVEHWDGILVFLISKKLDSTSRQFWELSLTDNSLPVLKDFLKFLETRGRALASSGVIRPVQPRPNQGQPQQPGPRVTHNHHVSTETPCKFCTQKHAHFQCPSFSAMPVEERRAVVKKLKLCFNCLQDSHMSSSCSSSKTCKKCKGKHHTLVHMEKAQPSSAPPAPPVLNHHTKGQLPVKNPTQTILATALITIVNHKGISHLCRALLDGGSTASFMTESCVRRTGLKKTGISGEVIGLSSASVGSIKGTATGIIKPHFPSDESYPLEFLCLQKITTRLPIHACDPTQWSHLHGLKLADPKFGEPGEIDVLIGADLFFNLITNGKKSGPLNSPVAINSTLGWLIAGSSSSPSSQVLVHVADVNLDQTLKKFWEIESVPIIPMHSKDDQLAEKHFQNTFKRDFFSGRYQVTLPFKIPTPKLGSTKEMALRRFLTLEKRLERQPKIRDDYVKFVQEYKALGHMVEAPVDHHAQSSQICFIPHHCVMKESSNTTKLRVVFDASAKSSNGISLNDMLLVGPTIQRSLVSILTTFRLHQVAITADIAKMFRQVTMDPACQDLQRILWRDNPKEPIKEYNLTTVTYGTASASFHATRVLYQLAEDEGPSFPQAASVLQEDLYMDDLMSGGQSDDEALTLQSQLNGLVKRGGFEFRQWASNSPALLESVPPELRASDVQIIMDNDGVVKTLGLHWRPGPDEFSFAVTLNPASPKWTKRGLLSEISKIFDPLGWLAPIIVRAKIFLQQLWKLDLGWDDPLPQVVQSDWAQFRASLPSIKKIVIPRCVMAPNPTNVQLIGFCDASEKAYSAVVYLRVDTHDGPRVSLITSKTRVAPTKTISLPRLELCGALLLAQLIPPTMKSLRLKDVEVRAYTDSTVALSWLNSDPSRWKTFVANRVTQAQELLPKTVWRHVRGDQNPADCASRGIDPAELQNHPLWWTGPPWLSSLSEIYSTLPNPNPNELKCEEKSRVVLGMHLRVDLKDALLFKLSSLLKIMRTTAWVIRFTINCRARAAGTPLISGPLTPKEIDDGLIHWVSIVQTNEFQPEIKALKKGKPLPENSKLLPLNPFLDDDGFLRVGGRIRKSQVPNDQKHPMILPRHHKLTELLILHFHHVNFHGRAQLLHSLIQRRFWILRARDAIRHQIRKCTTCTRHSATTCEALMGDLPSVRVTPARPFLNSGVDYAGPFVMRPIPGRSKVSFKAYLCLFICLCTRAIHLELVSALSTEAFLAALRRFIARRGRPSQIWSDCGSNFIGAAKELQELQSLIHSSSHNEAISNSLSSEGIKWNFNPPSAPHFGGLWEAGVKSVKFHLHRIIGDTRLTYEEMLTVLVQIEGCLNSRPLTPVSSDPNDLSALTPAHFLIGEPMSSAPDPDLTLEKLNRLSRWQLVQRLQQHFWNRWSNEFLSRLQQRPKWMKHREELKVGDLVLIKEDNLPPLQWKMGRILKTHPGSDGITRVVTLKTQDNELQRPIAKLCLLPLDESASDGI